MVIDKQAMTVLPEILLHNTKTRRKEVFKPIDPKNIRVYLRA
jgi:hypothetical protein